MATTLVVNPGSSSRKYALYRGGQCVLEFRFEDTNSGFEMCAQVAGIQQTCEAIKKNDFSEAFARVVEGVNSYLFRDDRTKQIDAVVIRVVAPGTFFQKHQLIDDAFVSELKRKESVAPLHIPVILREVESARKYYKQSKIIAASDSAFHREMPTYAREYSIPLADAEQFDIHRFGYHGLSVASIVRRIHPQIGQQPERMIVCHIGSGTSVTAVKDGRSVETTMGFSPATGLPMGSRAGDVDTAALLELMRVKHWRPADIEMYINTNGGFAGIAKETDIRRLLDRRAQHDSVATRALDTFAYHIQKAVAAQTIALGGLDVLVLTATAAVRSAELRAIILRGLAPLGIQISKERNDLLVGKDGVISARNSSVKVVVMRTDEMGEMAVVAKEMALGMV